MSSPREDPPAQAPEHRGPRSGTLGRVALRLGIATLICAVLAGLLWIPLDGTWYGALPLVGVPFGLAALVTGIIAIAANRGRRQGVIGLVLAVISGPAALILQVASYMAAYLFV